MKLKIAIWGLVAINVAIMSVIPRTTSHVSTAFLIAALFLANISILFSLRRLLRETDLFDRAVVLSDWTGYIPLVGGAVCVSIGIVELAWKPCAIGMVATAIGGLRIWSKRKMRQALGDRR